MHLNTLICLDENVSGYGKSQRRPSGHVTICSPGIVKCYVQNMIGLTDKDYVLYLISKKSNRAVRIGKLNDPCMNKQTTWKVDLEDIQGMGVCGKDIDAAAVVVEGDMIGSTDSVLVGYCKDKYLITAILEQALPKKVKPQLAPEPVPIKVETHTAIKEMNVPKAETMPIKSMVEVKPAVKVKPVVEIKPIIKAKPVEEVKVVTQPKQFDTSEMEAVDVEMLEEVELKSFEDELIIKKIKEALIEQIKEQIKAQVPQTLEELEKIKKLNEAVEKVEVKEVGKQMSTEKMEAMEKEKEKQKMEYMEKEKEKQKMEAMEKEKEKQKMEAMEKAKEKKKEAKDKRWELEEEESFKQTADEMKFLDEISQRLKRIQDIDTDMGSSTLQDNRYKEIREIFDRSEAIDVFDDGEEDISWVRISMDELTSIPQLDYEWCTQPMLIFCHHKFAHFILGKDRDMESYYIGIPDIYHNTRKYILDYDRIEKFKTSSGNSISNGEYGYWIARVE